VRSRVVSVAGALVILSGIVSAAQAQRPQGRGSAQRAAAAQPAAPSTPPQLSVIGLRIVNGGLGSNGTELQPFNDHPGTTLSIAVQAPKGSGIVAVDDDTSKLEAFADDKGQSLLEEGRIGPFPKVAEDGSAALVEVEVRGRPSAGATSLTVQGSLALTLANGSKPTRVANVKLEEGQTFKVGATTMTVNNAKVSDDGTSITLGLPRSVLQTLRETRFFDAKGAPIEARRAGSGYMNQKAEIEFETKTKDKVVTMEFELWQNPRTLKVPFNVQAGIGSLTGGKAADTTGSSAGKASETSKPEPATAAKKPAGPPPAIGPTDGAASVEAVVKQMQTAAVAGKGGQVLSVIYPTDRGTYGQGVAMALAFLPMGSMGDEKAASAMEKDLDAFFAKHQIKPPFTKDPEELFKGVDLNAFVTDAFAFMKGHAKKGDKPEDYLPVPSGKPENVKVDGDNATASLSGKDVNFAKIGGKWFIRL